MSSKVLVQLTAYHHINTTTAELQTMTKNEHKQLFSVHCAAFLRPHQQMHYPALTFGSMV